MQFTHLGWPIRQRLPVPHVLPLQVASAYKSTLQCCHAARTAGGANTAAITCAAAVVEGGAAWEAGAWVDCVRAHMGALSGGSPLGLQASYSLSLCVFFPLVL